MNRGRSGGTFTLATRSSPLTGSPTLSSKLSERFEMYGNGWPGSTARGVRTGKIWRSKTSTRYSRSSSSSDAQSDSLTPASASAGTICSKKIELWRSTSSSTRTLMAASVSAGLSPSDDLVLRPGVDLVLQAGDPDLEELVERLGEKIATNFTRSRTGRGVVFCQVEQAFSEIEPRELPVGEPGRPELPQIEPVLSRRDASPASEARGRAEAGRT